MTRVLLATSCLAVILVTGCASAPHPASDRAPVAVPEPPASTPASRSVEASAQGLAAELEIPGDQLTPEATYTAQIRVTNHTDKPVTLEGHLPLGVIDVRVIDSTGTIVYDAVQALQGGRHVHGGSRLVRLAPGQSFTESRPFKLPAAGEYTLQPDFFAGTNPWTVVHMLRLRVKAG